MTIPWVGSYLRPRKHTIDLRFALDNSTVISSNVNLLDIVSAMIRNSVHYFTQTRSCLLVSLSVTRIFQLSHNEVGWVRPPPLWEGDIKLVVKDWHANESVQNSHILEGRTYILSMICTKWTSPWSTHKTLGKRFSFCKVSNISREPVLISAVAELLRTRWHWALIWRATQASCGGGWRAGQ